MLMNLDKKVRANDCVTLADLQSEHACLRDFTKELSAHLSKLLETNQRRNMFTTRRYKEPKGNLEREAMLLRAKMKNNGTFL
jgi:hypothetical protein